MVVARVFVISVTPFLDYSCHSSLLLSTCTEDMWNSKNDMLPRVNAHRPHRLACFPQVHSSRHHGRDVIAPFDLLPSCLLSLDV